MKKKLLCITLLLVMIIGAIPVNAKETKINNYLETSFDVYNVPIVDSYLEFKEMIDSDKVKPAIEDKNSITAYTVKAKKNGCLVLCRKQSGHILLNDVKTKNTKQIAKFDNVYSSNSSVYHLIPMQKGDKISIDKSYAADMTAYIGYIPMENVTVIDESVKNTNGTLRFTFGNVYENDTVLSIQATKKDISSSDILANDVLAYKQNISYEVTSVSEDGDAILTLPEAGTYVLTIRLTMNDKSIAYQILTLDTDTYIVPTLDKLEEPISAITGTNVIVGFAEPFTTVYADYDGKTYNGKSDRNGIYRIVLSKDMKKGTKFKIWQKSDKLTSKKASYRVTNEL